MSIAHFLDRYAAELHPLDRKDDSTSFARGEIDQIAYKLPGDEDFSYITCNTEDDEIDALASHLTIAYGQVKGCPPTPALAEFLKNVRDEMQMAKTRVTEGDVE